MSLSGRFLCGGRLKVAERASEVVVTYVASAVGPGAMSCALVPLRVSLHKPLGQRSVIDGTTHKAIAIGRS